MCITETQFQHLNGRASMSGWGNFSHDPFASTVQISGSGDLALTVLASIYMSNALPWVRRRRSGPDRQHGPDLTYHETLTVTKLQYSTSCPTRIRRRRA